MSMELIEVQPEIEDIVCGVCVKHKSDKSNEITEYCPNWAVEQIGVEVPEQDQAWLPVCESHLSALEKGGTFVIKERGGERKFMIQFTLNPQHEPPLENNDTTTL